MSDSLLNYLAPAVMAVLPSSPQVFLGQKPPRSPRSFSPRGAIHISAAAAAAAAAAFCDPPLHETPLKSALARAPRVIWNGREGEVELHKEENASYAM